MADVSFKCTISEEIKNEFSTIQKESGMTWKEFILHLMALYRNNIGQGEVAATKDLGPNEMPTNEINTLYEYIKDTYGRAKDLLNDLLHVQSLSEQNIKWYLL